MSNPRDKRSIESLDDLYRESIKAPEAAEHHVQDGLSEDFLSGDVYSADSSPDGSYGQVIMFSLASHDPGWHGKELAIAADKMRVTVKICGGKPLSSYQLNHGLEQLGVSHGLNWKAMALVEAHSKAGILGEVVVATGTPAEPRRSVTFPEVQRGFNLDGSIFWLSDGVKLDGQGLRDILFSEALERIDKNTLLVKAVSAGTILATIYENPEAKAGTNVLGEVIDPADDLLPERGDNVRHNERAGTYEAAVYGYLVLEGNTMSVLPPLWVSPDHLGAYYVNCTQLAPPLYPSGVDLIDSLLRLKIKGGTIRRSIIDKLTDRLCQGQLLSARTIKIAEAISPAAGRNASFKFCVDMGSKADSIRSDGTVDLGGRNAVVCVQAGTLIAQKTTATKGVRGFDLFGESIEAEDGLDLAMTFDDVFRSEDRDGVISYFAKKNGNIRFEQGILTIADIYTVAGNVDSNTGSLELREDVQIHGSVLAGFTVRSPGNISIAGSVYNGATILAGGDVTIGEGITGSETKVVVRGNLQAVFIQEAEVVVKGDTVLGSYLYNAVLRANGAITVLSTPVHGHKSGRIIGGLTCSSKRIQVSRVGHPGQTGTVLAILPDPECSGQMKKLDEEGRNCRESIARISRSLPFENFDSTVIKKALAKMPAENREPVIKLLTTFNNLIKRQQNIEALRKEINGRILSDLRNGSIQITEEICQGSEIQFGDKKVVLSADLSGTTFTLQGGEIV